MIFNHMRELQYSRGATTMEIRELDWGEILGKSAMGAAQVAVVGISLGKLIGADTETLLFTVGVAGLRFLAAFFANVSEAVSREVTIDAKVGAEQKRSLLARII